jgi:ribosomal protein S18 acetylase RimI-like enzyme
VYRIAAQSFPSVWSEKEFCYFLAHENRLCLGVFSEWQGHKRLRAYFLGLLVQGDLDIISLATLPEDRRLGLGSQLLAAVCAKEGVRRAFLEVETSNEAAFSLYSKSGFVLLGRRNEYYGPERDAYLMRWER